MSTWNYTAAERRTIGAAWDAVAYLMDASGHREPHRLREALKVEKRERSCITAARAMIVRGFAEGMADDPPASTLAGYSEWIAAGVMLGADYQRRALRFSSDSAAGSLVEKLPSMLAAASASHDAYVTRGLASTRESIGT